MKGLAENDDATSTSSFRWFDRGLLAATLLTCAVAVSPNLPDPDLWGHVQYGRDALQHGLPTTTTYSYSAEGYRWINHENLAELFLAIGIDSLGPVGMLWVKCLLGVAVIGLVMTLSYRAGVGPLATSVVSMLVAVNLTYFWSMRPQLFSFVYYALLLTLLRWCFHGWEGRCHVRWLRGDTEQVPPLSYSSFRMRFLWVAPVLFCLWANTHGGFVAGYCIFAAYLSMRGLEAFLVRGAASFGLLRRLFMMILAGLMGTLINPYGPGLHLWLLNSLRIPRPEIVEWHAPDLTSTIMMPLWLIVICWFAVLLFSKRSRDATHFAILAVTLWQSLEHARHIPFFAIAFGFWMAPHVESVLARFNVASNVNSFGRDLNAGMKSCFAGVLLVAFALLGARLYGRLSEMPVDRQEYPVGAFQYLADREVHGRMVVTYNWAQYAIAAFGPRIDPPNIDPANIDPANIDPANIDPADDDEQKGLLVSFDGRFRTCYPQHVVDMNFDFVLGTLEPRYRGSDSPPFNDRTVLEHGSPDLVLINRRQPHSVNVMFRNRGEWALLYQDRIAQVWGRRARYDDPAQRDFIPDDLRLITDDEQVGTVAWPAYPVRRGKPPADTNADTDEERISSNRSLESSSASRVAPRHGGLVAPDGPGMPFVREVAERLRIVSFGDARPLTSMG